MNMSSKTEQKNRPTSAGLESSDETAGPDFHLFSKLPDEIQREVLDRLGILSKIQLRRVCNKWNGLLREDSLLRLVILNEKSALKICPEYQVLTPEGIHSSHNFSKLMQRLSELGVWEKVRHFVFEGNYDIRNAEPTADRTPYSDSPLFRTVLNRIYGFTGGKKDSEFESLKTIEIHRTAVELNGAEWVSTKTPKRKLIVTDGSFVFINIYFQAGNLRYATEFVVNGTRTFDLSVPAEGSYWHQPAEIANFIEEQCDAVPAETVAQLGELYSVLLMGRPGFIVRLDVVDMFKLLLDHNPGYDRTRPVWQQCHKYDFSQLDNRTKYALVYYTKPRNCYQVPTTQMPGYRPTFL